MALWISKRPAGDGARATNSRPPGRFSTAKSQRISALFLEIADPDESFFEKISVKRICGSFYRVQF